MKMFLPASAVVAALLSPHGAAVHAFAPARAPRGAVVAPSAARATAGPAPRPIAPSPLRAEAGADAGAARPSRRARLLSALRRRARPAALAVLASAALGGGPLLAPPARASAPIVLRPAMKKKEPPMQKALEQAAEAKKRKSMAEFDAHVARCNAVEKAEGKAARAAFEREYHAERARAEAQKAIDVETLQRKLLDLGQDPFTEPDAQREVFLLEHDVDLRKVIGTDQNRLVAQNFIKQGKAMRKGGGKAEEVPSSTEAARFIVAAQVADLKAQGNDPLPHFLKKEVREETRRIYKMDKGSAERAAAKYRTLMRRFGRLTPSQEGEVPFVYVSKSVEEVAAAPKPSAAEDRRARAARRTAEKETARAARHAAKAEKKAQKVSAKSQKHAERASAASARKAAQEELQAEEAAAFEAGAVVAAEAGAAVAAAALGAPSAPPLAALAAPAPPSQPDGAGGMVAKIKLAATPRNGVAVLVGGGAVAFGANYLKENGGAAQKERERQLRLILGDDEDEDDEEDDDDEDDDEYEQFTKQQMSPEPPQAKPDTDKSTTAPKAATPPPPTPPVAAPPAKPKRLGIFSKRNANARETNLNALVKPAAPAPAFATLLAQLLAFGAPGRFPAVASWGPSPLDDFELDEAKALLTAARGENAALADDATSAGVFAAVVNCMLIDIVDLASSTLKGKKQEDKVTVDALNVVMDFMDHAASLFDAVAEDVTIKPVIYGGKLRKKDLEQMFSMYAGSSMMSMDALTGGGSGGGATQDRVDTLQLVFAITDKKAEGLMQKHMMKMMMNLMKDGGEGLEGMKGMPGMEGMEDMAAMLGGGGAGGMPGMPGMPGMDGGEMSMEDLKQTLDMMKDMKDSGQVSEAELVEIRNQFKELYGSDVSGLIKKAEEEGTAGGMTDDEKELLDMFKWILGEE